MVQTGTQGKDKTILSNFVNDWLLFKVLRPTRHKLGHFADVPKANLLVLYGRKQNVTQQTHTFID